MLSEETRGIHGPQRGPVSITQITEKGRCYRLEEIHQISKIKSKFSSQLHMDGARFANALLALNCSPAEMTWKAGVDAVTFGCTKNGLLGVEAVISLTVSTHRNLSYEENERDIYLQKIDISQHKCSAIWIITFG